MKLCFWGASPIARAFPVMFLLAWSFPSAAMDFRLFFHPDLQINIVIAEGPIVSGDAERFLEISHKADRDAEGHVGLVLNSFGGSVEAAFEMVNAMDKVGVFTIVPDNAICASACASIIYPSGIRRSIVGTGRLGFHSCYAQIGGKIEESAFCNEKIAEHAVSRGIAHASVNLFVEDFGAKEMAWVDRDVACTMLPGMCRPTLRNPQPTSESNVKPSFDCAKARTLVEKLICANPRLASMDARMAISYFTLRTRIDDSKGLLKEQRAWLRDKRNSCDDLECLAATYQIRIRTLEARMGRLPPAKARNL